MIVFTFIVDVSVFEVSFTTGGIIATLLILGTSVAVTLYKMRLEKEQTKQAS